MFFNSETREQLRQKFIDSHGIDDGFRKFYGDKCEQIYEMIKNNNNENGIYENLFAEICAYRGDIGNYLRKKHEPLLKLCFENEDEAQIICDYFGKISEFAYKLGYFSMPARSKKYKGAYEIIKTLCCGYNLQMYNCTIAEFILDEISDELKDIKHNGNIGGMIGLDNIIAAHIYADDKKLVDAITKIFENENYGTLITDDIIRGIAKSDNEHLHNLLGKMVVTAGLQEGLRQSICENMVCGTKKAFYMILNFIYDNDLMRFTSVRRAVSEWTLIFDSSDSKRILDNVFNAIYNAIKDKKTCDEYIESGDKILVLAGLWCIGFEDDDEELKRILEISISGNVIQKQAAIYYGQFIRDSRASTVFIYNILSSPDADVEIAAKVFKNYMLKWQNELYKCIPRDLHGVCYGLSIISDEHIKPFHIDLSKWFNSEQEARANLKMLYDLLAKMNNKKYEFKPYYSLGEPFKITKSQVMVHIAIIANGINDNEIMNELAQKLDEFDSSGDRGVAVLLLLANQDTDIKRSCVINALTNRESNTRLLAKSIVRDLTLTDEEYDRISEFLMYKSPEIRLNVMDIIKSQPSDGLCRSLEKLLLNKRESMRLAGLDILKSLIENNGDEHIISTEIKIIKKYVSVSDGEQMLIDEIISLINKNESSNSEIELPEISYNSSNYPLFDVSETRLEELFSKFNALVEKYNEYEYRSAFGENIVIGNVAFLPPVQKGNNAEETMPLFSVWKEFFDINICSQKEFYAMLLSTVMFNKNIRNSKYVREYEDDLQIMMKKLFSEAVVNASKISRRHLITNIIREIEPYFSNHEFAFNAGIKAIEYLCESVPDNLRIYEKESYIFMPDKKELITLLDNEMIARVVSFALNNWKNEAEFKKYFFTMLRLDRCYIKSALIMYYNDNNKYFKPHEKFNLSAIDFCYACYKGLISEKQMYENIFDKYGIINNIENLMSIYTMSRFAYVRKSFDRYFKNDADFEKYLIAVADKVVDIIVDMECKRGDMPAEYSPAVIKINCVYNIDNLAQLLKALGKNKIVRNKMILYSESKNISISHLLSVCCPRDTDTDEIFKEKMDNIGISEKRLIEFALFAPKWIPFVEKYLGLTGFMCVAYYFIAHTNKFLSDEEFAVIAKYTQFEKQELLDGMFDIEWFKQAHNAVSEQKFELIYNCAKYISDSNKHMRAKRYTDAALGKVYIDDVENEINEKRNKDLLMSYPLIPIKNKEDLIRRYKFIHEFLNQSKKFGSARRMSEKLACDVALKNLASSAGFADVTRLTLVAENEMADSLSDYFKWNEIKSDSNIRIRIALDNNSMPYIEVEKNGKVLKTVPSACKKDEYFITINESVKLLKEQYKRTVKMFEKSMVERELYSVEELETIIKNPIIKPIIDNILFVDDNSGLCGFMSDFERDCSIRVAHSFDLYKSGEWKKWQEMFFEKRIVQPFRQVFRELYLKLDEEKDKDYSQMFSGYQVQINKTIAVLKNVGWIATHETGLEKIFYKDNVIANILPDEYWFMPIEFEIEMPTIEYVSFTDRKTGKSLKISEVSDIVYSETMRDTDLAVSTCYAGGADIRTSHSTIEMRKVIIENNLALFGIKNVKLKDTHAFIYGKMGEYTVNLGSGVVHMVGAHMLIIMPVHSQHRGKIFLPFIDEDQKTAEIISKILLLADDVKIKDTYILKQIKG